jgi:RNA polymerase primary sigma factor
MLAKMIMDAMEEYIAENVENGKADQKVADRVNKVADEARNLAEELRRKVTVQELAGETGLSENRIREAMRMSGFQIEDLADE